MQTFLYHQLFDMLAAALGAATEEEKTPARIAIEPRPGGPTTKRQPSPEGLGYQSEVLSAVGAALFEGY
jgi:hypothetical protein